MPHGETLQVPLDRPAAKAPFRLALPWDLAGDQPAVGELDPQEGRSPDQGQQSNAGQG